MQSCENAAIKRLELAQLLGQLGVFLTQRVSVQMRPEMLEGAGLLQLDGRHAAAGARLATGDAAILNF